jgi:hypothetical protein
MAILGLGLGGLRALLLVVGASFAGLGDCVEGRPIRRRAAEKFAV